MAQWPLSHGSAVPEHRRFQHSETPREHTDHERHPHSTADVSGVDTPAGRPIWRREIQASACVMWPRSDRCDLVWANLMPDPSLRSQGFRDRFGCHEKFPCCTLDFHLAGPLHISGGKARRRCCRLQITHVPLPMLISARSTNSFSNPLDNLPCVGKFPREAGPSSCRRCDCRLARMIRNQLSVRNLGHWYRWITGRTR